MQQPTRITVTWAADGNKNTINVDRTASDENNKATYRTGFPQVTMTPKASGGLPPFGKDMNGILADITSMLQYHQAGMTYPFDDDFADAIGGYNRGALVLQDDKTGFWVSTVNENTSNPEIDGNNWVPLNTGALRLTLTNANRTLTPAQAAHPVVILSGALTNNVTLFFPTFLQTWCVLNNCTGNYSVTCKTANGSGVKLKAGITQIVCDGTNILSVTASQSSLVPTGSILSYPGTSIPEGYLLANGQAVSRTLYADLFAVYGETYGAGDGSTTFGLPNYVGKFVRFGNIADVGRIVQDSIRSHTHAVTQQAHTHELIDNGHSHTVNMSYAGGHTHTRGSQNITGSFAARNLGDSAWIRASGAFTGISNGDQGSDGKHGGVGFNFDASRSWTGETSSNGSHIHTATCLTALTGILMKSATIDLSIDTFGSTETAPIHIYGLPIIKY